SPGELRSTAGDRIALRIALFPTGPAHVSDQRDLALLPGRNTVQIEGIPSGIDLTGLHWTLPEDRTLIRLHANTDQLEAELFAGDAGSRPLTLRYALPELNWQVDYRLVIGDASNESQTAQLSRFLTLINETDQAFATPDVILNSPYGEWINLSLNSTLAANSQLRQPLGSPVEASVTTRLVTRGRADTIIAHPSQYPAEQRIQFNASDLQWPAGNIEVAQELPDGRMATSRQTQLSAVTGDGQAFATIPSASDVNVTKVLEGIEQKGADEIQLNWALTINNDESQPITLLLEEQLDPRWAIEKATGDWRRAGGLIYREISIDAGSSEQIELQVRGPFNPQD
ncbi:MAG: hypothetical protein KGY57_05620, partial [Gammaproteobacteria bacterium]|nr:hypothetical protein [Gammaproteobacteria bacterium]